MTVVLVKYTVAAGLLIAAADKDAMQTRITERINAKRFMKILPT